MYEVTQRNRVTQYYDQTNPLASAFTLTTKYGFKQQQKTRIKQNLIRIHKQLVFGQYIQSYQLSECMNIGNIKNICSE